MNFSLFLRVPNLIRPLSIQTSALNFNSVRFFNVSSVDFRARKGYREKARKKKVKVIEPEKVFVPRSILIEKRRRGNYDLHTTDDHKPLPIDDVYIMKNFRWKMYSVNEAIHKFRYIYHPTMYDNPKSPIYAKIELNMQGEKKTKIKDNIVKTVLIPHPFFVDDDRKILAFSKNQQLQNDMLDAGATQAGGLELIKKIQAGDIKIADFDYVLAQPDILSDLLPIRGIMKKKFPSELNESVSEDLMGLLIKFQSGIVVESKKDFVQANFGYINTRFGTINMDPLQLEANLVAIIRGVNLLRPKRAGPFITRVYLESPPYKCIIKIDPFLYIPKEPEKLEATKQPVKKPTVVQEEEESDSDDEEAEDGEGVKAEGVVV